jgi:bacterioferritin (cytochrome b1)
MGGDDPLEMLRATVLAKYKLADSEELFYNLCSEIGHDDICGIFETGLENEEYHIDYLREQAIIMAHERITGVSATE